MHFFLISDWAINYLESNLIGCLKLTFLRLSVVDYFDGLLLLYFLFFGNTDTEGQSKIRRPKNESKVELFSWSITFLKKLVIYVCKSLSSPKEKIKRMRNLHYTLGFFTYLATLLYKYNNQIQFFHLAHLQNLSQRRSICHIALLILSVRVNI